MITGFVQAENFDNGGEGVAFHDTTAGNAGNVFRNTSPVTVSSVVVSPTGRRP